MTYLLAVSSKNIKEISSRNDIHILNRCFVKTYFLMLLLVLFPAFFFKKNSIRILEQNKSISFLFPHMCRWGDYMGDLSDGEKSLILTSSHLFTQKISNEQRGNLGYSAELCRIRDKV